MGKEMLIKCPFCKTNTEIQISDDPRLLLNHIKSAHYDRTCIEEYSNLVMKIHEMFAELDNKPPSTTNTIQNWIDSGKKIALKSLLEG